MSPRQGDDHSSAGASRFARKTVLGFWIVAACLTSAPALFGQKVKIDVTTLDDLFFNELKNLVMPKNAVELAKGPSLNITGAPAPLRMVMDSAGNIYISEAKKATVVKLNSAGIPDEEFAGNVAKKKRLTNPRALSIQKDMLLVLDQERIVVCDLSGKFVNSLRIPNADDMAIDENGSIFVSPSITDPRNPLVETYTMQGKKVNSFGSPLNFRHSLGELNRRSLLLNGDMVYVVFKFFPVIRKYSKNGEFIEEFRIEDNFIRIKEEFNLKRLGEGIADPAKRFGYAEIISSASVFDGLLYAISGYPLLMIYEIGNNGKVKTIYWKDMEEIYVPKDLAIDEANNEIRFRVLRGSPDSILDVFSAHRRR
ncbi:MAG: hypothetical protein NTU60_07985 [Candidatus Aminicenantes bacterium]|nr:hypothetical protein [Candidatus Aminicenantes bacterium]